MNNKKKTIQGMNVGSSSILVTFVLLCLVTFAALSFVSANSDNKLSRQAADRMDSYYDANRMAEVYLLNIDSQLQMLANNCNGQDEYFDNIEKTFSDNSSLVIHKENNDYYIQYSIAVSDIQELNVKLLVIYPENNNVSPFIIKEWETVSTYSGDEGAADNGIGFIF